ncbi:hypothetical protein GCM10027258_62360 [Amycolatopsis stemonae]
MTSFTDDFNRADSSTVGNGWVEVAEDWSISSNRLAAPATGGTGIITCGTAMATDDNSAQATIAVAAAVSCGVWCRGDSVFGNGYLWRNDGTSWDLFRNVSGSFTSLATYAVAASNGDVAKIQAVGSTIKAYVNGVERASVTDTGIVTGKNTGMRCAASSTVRYDDFAAADVTAGTSANAGHAAGTGAASAPAAKVSAAAGQATGTGTASSPSAAVSAAAGAGIGAGSAAAPTPTLGGRAGAAAGPGASSGPAGSVAAAAGIPAGTGAANAPTPATAAGAGQATGTGAAADATVLTGAVAAGRAAAAGAAYSPAAAVTAHAGHAAGTGTARQPTASAADDTADAHAGRASGTGHAHAPTVITQSAKTGSWYGLLDIYREAAQLAADERERPRLACPHDGEPLVEGLDGDLFCRFDGWKENAAFV